MNGWGNLKDKIMDIEIKFRQPIRNKNGDFIEWFYWDIYVSPAIQQNGLDTRGESQQYTGLKDKNGKEIYEGDVLDWNSTIVECKWEKQACAFWINWKRKVDYKNEKVNHYDFMSATFSDGETYINETMEVIGNIYENPNLL